MILGILLGFVAGMALLVGALFWMLDRALTGPRR